MPVTVGLGVLADSLTAEQAKTGPSLSLFVLKARHDHGKQFSQCEVHDDWQVFEQL